MIGVTLEGGLGNQMFEYAAARVAAERLNCAMVVHRQGMGPRGLEFFNHRKIAAELGEVFPAAIQARIGVMLQGLRDSMGDGAYLAVRAELFPHHFAPRELQVMKIPYFETYDTAYHDIGHGTWLTGYYQSEGYFSGVEDKVRSWFATTTPAREERIAMLLKSMPAPPEDMIAVHIRRGDYVTNRGTAVCHPTMGWALPMDFYQSALELLPPGQKYAFFSDDHEFIREHFSHLNPWTSPGQEGVVDLLLMARCRRLVMANSSMSWWSAWLNTHPQAEIIAPRFHIGRHIDQWYPAGIETRGWTYV